MNQVEKEKDFFYYKDYPWVVITLRWFFLLLVFVLGLYIFLDFKQVLAYLYVFYAIFCLSLIFPLSRCVYCFYFGRFCNTGWGKVSAFLFEKKDEEEYLRRSSFYVLTYPLWFLPGLLALFELVLKRNLKYLILFCGFVLLWLSGKFFLKWVCCKRCNKKDFCPEVPFKR